MMRSIGIITAIFLTLGLAVFAEDVPRLQPDRPIDLLDPSAKDWLDVKQPELVTILQVIDSSDNGAHVNDQTIESLARFPNVRALVLSSEHLTDAAIPHLLKLKQLEALAIYGCQFSDDGIQKLQSLAVVQTIGFFQTKVTTRGLEQLKEKLPNAQLEAGRFGQGGTVFKADGCLTGDFKKKHLKL